MGPSDADYFYSPVKYEVPYPTDTKEMLEIDVADRFLFTDIQAPQRVQKDGGNKVPDLKGFRSMVLRRLGLVSNSKS